MLETWTGAITFVNGLNRDAVNVFSKSDSDARPFQSKAFTEM